MFKTDLGFYPFCYYNVNDVDDNDDDDDINIYNEKYNNNNNKKKKKKKNNKKKRSMGNRYLSISNLYFLNEIYIVRPVSFLYSY